MGACRLQGLLTKMRRSFFECFVSDRPPYNVSPARPAGLSRKFGRQRSADSSGGSSGHSCVLCTFNRSVLMRPMTHRMFQTCQHANAQADLEGISRPPRKKKKKKKKKS